jgi:ubiquinone biosynthesis monooxygenase Coq7
MNARRPNWRPGDDRADIPSMIRVDQAGEYGATRIYAGQLAVLGDRHPASRVIARMALQEKRHLDHFNELMTDRGIRPTVLQPIWNVAGHALGAVTALMGPSAAMACTAAVETEIDKHYSEQVRCLGEDDPDLSATITEFQARSSSIATPRSPRAPRTRSAIRSFPLSSRGLPRRNRAFEEDMIMKKMLLGLLAGELPCSARSGAAGAGRTRSGAAAPRQFRGLAAARDRRPDDRCRGGHPRQPADRLWQGSLPASSEDEIIVCARRPENDRFRIPAPLRDDGAPAANSWANRATELQYVGRQGIGSCSPVGPGGASGCLVQFINQARAERGGGDQVNWNALIEQARRDRLGRIDADSEEIERELNPR